MFRRSKSTRREVLWHFEQGMYEKSRLTLFEPFLRLSRLKVNAVQGRTAMRGTSYDQAFAKDCRRGAAFIVRRAVAGNDPARLERS
jgi:hypothetical protein